MWNTVWCWEAVKRQNGACVSKGEMYFGYHLTQVLATNTGWLLRHVYQHCDRAGSSDSRHLVRLRLLKWWLSDIVAPVANPTVRGQKHQSQENECACLVSGQKKYELILTFSFPYFWPTKSHPNSADNSLFLTNQRLLSGQLCATYSAR